MDPKKRKVDSENRRFLAEWTEQYCFTLPDRPQAVPVCLICNKTVAIVKSGNLKRHYETTHQQFHKNFPLGIRCMSEQKNSQKQRYVCPGRLINTINHFQILRMKECMLPVVTTLFEEKKDVVAAIQSILLSARSNTRRTEILAADIKNILLKLLQKAPCYAIALNELCDIVDEEQMSIFLAVLPLKGNTRGEDLFKVINEFITKSSISYDKVVSFSTDGAPTIIGIEKKEIAVSVKFLADFRNEFATKFQDFAEIDKLSPFLKSPFEIDVAAERTDVAAKLINLPNHHCKWKYLICKKICLQMYKTVSTEEFWAKHVPEEYENCKKLAINLATTFGSTYVCKDLSRRSIF
ncbi:hypothetical protein RN001_015283 [Aquatica leii]|uniref:SPIN-DOC-like zinc-finger domain-containing protein n=1 Tax=Aquatica leii TaxID=1421715 RepID=A0AAN7SD05_9COLE|nr:hypothetical protein RN001_015283 [Aquatica leii]